MKTTILPWRSLGIAVWSSCLLFAACSKQNNDTSPTTIPAQNHATVSAEMQANTSFDDVFLNVLGVDPSVAIGGTGIFYASRQASSNQRETPCYTVSWAFVNQNDSFPVRITVDFGPGCTGWDGRIRKGKISTLYSQPLWMFGATATSTFNQYSVDGIQVEGTHTITNKSQISQLIFSTSINEGRLTGTDGTVITWSGHREFTQKEGWNTIFDPTDDLYSFTSQGSGTCAKDGKTYSWTGYTIEALEKRATCQWIAKGKQGINGNAGAQGVLAFGTGECDNKATLTVNGVSAEITLK